MNSAKILFGTLVGLVIGVQVGILVAPEKGKDTRKKLTKKGDEYINELNSSFNEFLEGLTKKIDKVNKNILASAEEGKAKGKELINQAKEKVK